MLALLCSFLSAAIASTLGGFICVVNLTSCTTASSISPPANILESSMEEQFLAIHTSGIQKTLREICEGEILDYNQAILLFPSNSESYKNRAFAHYSIGNSKLTLKDLDHTLQLQPTMAMAYADRSMIRLELGDLSGAHTDSQNTADLFASQGNSEFAEKMQTWVKQEETTSNLQRVLLLFA